MQSWCLTSSLSTKSMLMQMQHKKMGDESCGEISVVALHLASESHRDRHEQFLLF